MTLEFQPIPLDPSHLPPRETKPVELKVAAIDVGYGRIKAVTGRDAQMQLVGYSFPAIATPAKTRSLGGGYMRERSTSIIVIDGTPYEYGEDAILATRMNSSRPMNLDYVTSIPYKALMYGALDTMNVTRIDTLVLGAPVENYERVRDVLTKDYTGDVHLGNGKTVSIRRVRVLPQPLGGWVEYAATNEHNLDYNTLKSHLSLVFDPGYFTLDWLVTRGSDLVVDRCGSHTGGMSELIKTVLDEMQRNGVIETRSLFLEDAIDRYFYTDEKFMLRGRDYDLQQHAGPIKAILREGLDRAIEQIGNGDDIQHIIVVGGAAPIYAPAIQQRFPDHRIEVSKTSAMSNVNGFYIIGELLSSEG